MASEIFTAVMNDLKYSNVFDKIQSRMIVFSIHIEG